MQVPKKIGHYDVLRFALERERHEQGEEKPVYAYALVYENVPEEGRENLFIISFDENHEEIPLTDWWIKDMDDFWQEAEKDYPELRWLQPGDKITDNTAEGTPSKRVTSQEGGAAPKAWAGPQPVIGQDELEVLLWRGDDDSDRTSVRLIHTPTGIESKCDEHDTQIANYDAALAELEQKIAKAFEQG